MSTPVFDHIEVYVYDVERYCQFLQSLFSGGRYRKISDSGTSMYKGPSGLNVEIKRRTVEADCENVGFCLPCVRLAGARVHIEVTLGLTIDRTIVNSSGEVHFFRDHEGIEWHAKDYNDADEYVNW